MHANTALLKTYQLHLFGQANESARPIASVPKALQPARPVQLFYAAVQCSAAGVVGSYF